MDAKTLSEILGHYSVSFTLDTYAHVLNEHKQEGMALMEDLFNVRSVCAKPYSYPVIITMQDSNLQFDVPDFPDISFSQTDLGTGVQYIKERLSEEVLAMPYPPEPTSQECIALGTDQIIMQVTL